MALVNVGRVRPVLLGDYDETVSYEFYDCVRYNGTWWLCILEEETTVAGEYPVEGSVWTAFGVKGDTGMTGESGTIEIGNVTTGDIPSIVNVGTTTAAVLDFVIPAGQKGDKGDKGDSFKISKTYSSIEDMYSDYSTCGLETGDMVIISTGDVEQEDNAKLFVFTVNGFNFVTDMSGARGIKGEAGESATVSIGSVSFVDTASEACITNSGTSNNAILDFAIPKGDRGYGVVSASMNSDGELVFVTDAPES